MEGIRDTYGIVTTHNNLMRKWRPGLTACEKSWTRKSVRQNKHNKPTTYQTVKINWIPNWDLFDERVRVTQDNPKHADGSDTIHKSRRLWRKYSQSKGVRRLTGVWLFYCWLSVVGSFSILGTYLSMLWGTEKAKINFILMSCLSLAEKFWINQEKLRCISTYPFLHIFLLRPSLVDTSRARNLNERKQKKLQQKKKRIPHSLFPRGLPPQY